ncbi:hypothetical protein METBIDRAFT_33783 [Metschnikowia bicuspidata var. bicuspidata NRRL YB-4993]|uniref:Uncharacterized protein n=1 Tax=Metschnikowia bicuspidata var. bicuspidata NRRL YB-4993 TaxID=869754 RepID=A0A1A0H255_9ASCO|nr:hypothetical protein METBIDRAFT_33783 [Metschnikowia bicuspidata var. bicuspidata NRRL YB-4993]OBA18038.1 hypothetical protein METBIDRAFT_33783 [Metschnikowia bicuspidata var. bicuspidata NRRL YB-4993]
MAAPQFSILSPNIPLSVALRSLNNVGRTTRNVFTVTWPQPMIIYDILVRNPEISLIL